VRAVTFPQRTKCPRVHASALSLYNISTSTARNRIKRPGCRRTSDHREAFVPGMGGCMGHRRAREDNKCKKQYNLTVGLIFYTNVCFTDIWTVASSWLRMVVDGSRPVFDCVVRAYRRKWLSQRSNVAAPVHKMSGLSRTVCIGQWCGGISRWVKKRSKSKVW
jgi:hypothetical protein